MSSPKLLHTMLTHEYWGNLRVIETMQQCAEVPERARILLGHMAASQHVWISRIQGVPFTMEVFPDMQPEACRQLFEQHHHQLMQWANDEQQLQTVVAYTTTTGKSFSNTVEGLLTHICLHSQYHRGQINQLLKPLVDRVLDVDYIQYLRSL